MRAYSASAEEALHARDLLKDWAGEGFITAGEHERLDQETISDLRRTNVFLRIVLFLFSVLIVVAAIGLFYVLFLKNSSESAAGILLLFSAAICYVAAELAVSQARLYRHGIEEALAVCSVGLLCLGLELAVFSHSPHEAGFAVPAAGVIVSLWIWHRFGLFYAPLAVMLFAAALPGYFTSSHAAQHAIVAALYTLGLVTIALVRRSHRHTCLNEEYSIAEALLWLGIYLALNLQVWEFLSQWWAAFRGASPEVSGPFYWTTWVLIWCLPPVVLARGLREKDRFVIAAGAIAALLTFATNKPYLGWPRHTWDPMLLGALLIAVALLLRRWLSAGPGEIRHGFTARRLSGKDISWMNTGSSALGLVSPSTLTPSPQTEFRFGGGESGGGGASSDF